MKRQGIYSLRRLSEMLTLLFVIALPGAVFAAQTELSAEPPAEPEEIKPLRVSEMVYLSTRPSYRDVDAQGIDLVIDLRYPYEGVYEDMGSLKVRGIQVLNIPISSKGPTLQNVERLADALADEKRILIHDSNGHRTAALWGAYRLWQGEMLEQVLEELGSLYEADELRPMLDRFRTEALAEKTEIDRSQL